MKFYVDEKWVYFVREVMDKNNETRNCLHKVSLDAYGFFNTANALPIYDLFIESENMNDFNNLKRLENLLMPKNKLSQEAVQLTLF
jgi:hypothetical protein